MKPFVACLLLLLLFGIILAQLFYPVPAGLANNGDFGKVIGRKNFVSVDNNGSDNFIYFVNEYYYESKFHYDSEMMTSEYTIFLVSAWAAHHFFGGTLELRQHGLLHLGLLSVGLVLAGLAICRLGTLRFALAAVIGVCVFSDIAYTAYLNSFYMDASALVGIVICLGAGLCLGLRDLPALTMAPLFCLGVLLVVTSKTQHSMLAVPALALYAALIWSDNRRSVRITALMLTLVVLGAAAAQMRSTKHDYAAKAAYNVIFHKILPVSATPAADLDWFGLPREYQKMSGMHAFLPNSPCNDPAWLDAFASKVSPKDIGLFWLQHPLRFLDAAWRDLIVSIHEVRPVNLTNVRRARAVMI
jgi:hypothetical protein